jgi:hypothetical protein
MKNITYHDYKPATLNFRDAVIDGFSGECKWISPKFFYD